MKRIIGKRGSAEELKNKPGWNRYSARLINKILRDSYRAHSCDRATRMAVKRCLG